MHTDASNEGIGGTLSRIKKDGLEHPIAFISRSLNPAERNYSTTEKVLLAAQLCMHKLRHLLFGQRFDLYTDHQALRSIFNNKSDDVASRIVKLLSKTTDYHPNIIYKRGKDNVVADALPRTFYATEQTTSAKEDIEYELDKLIKAGQIGDISQEELELVDEILCKNPEIPVENPSTSQQKLVDYLEKRQNRPLPKLTQEKVVLPSNPLITPETLKRFEKLTLNKNYFISINQEKSLTSFRSFMKIKNTKRVILPASCHKRRYRHNRIQ